MEKLAHLTQLLAHCYAKHDPVLTPVHLFAHDNRGIYRVDSPGAPPLLLRAYQQEPTEMDWLAERAATLLYLAATDYPAPRVIPTVDGELLGYHQGWSALLLTYIEGEMTTGSAAEVQAIGQQLARLHNVKVGTADPPIPYCRWQPTSKITNWIAGLEAVAGQFPVELTGLFDFSLATLHRIAQWPTMPVSILHADPNSTNTVRTLTGAFVFVDWDGAGLGPPLLDLGYLLLTCHLVLPSWPQIEPAHDLIATIMTGYCSVRPLSAEEVAALPVAVALNDAIWVAQGIPAVIGQDWRQHRGLHRFGARYPALARVGEIAQEIVAQL